MSMTLKAIYKNGAFVPVASGEKLNVPEDAEVELTVHHPRVLSATAENEEERERAWRALIASWDAYPLRADAPRLSRDEMHERR
jgi:hypothetical protein